MSDSEACAMGKQRCHERDIFLMLTISSPGRSRVADVQVMPLAEGMSSANRHPSHDNAVP